MAGLSPYEHVLNQLEVGSWACGEPRATCQAVTILFKDMLNQLEVRCWALPL